MKGILKSFSLGVVSSLLLFSNSFAACYGSSPNLTAASAMQSDVAACVAMTNYGDTITIPACAAGNCTWASGITITKDIKIVGSGVDATTLTGGFPGDSSYYAFFKFVPDATARERLSRLDGQGTFEISGITFSSTSKFGIWCYNPDLPIVKRVKIHNNKFINTHIALYATGYIYGVFYNNQLMNSSGAYTGGANFGSFTNDRMNLGSGKGWYVEDNTFSFSGSQGGVSGAGNMGGGHVVRYNTVTGAMYGGSTYVETHGNQLSFIGGPQITEVYGNYMPASGNAVAVKARGGKNIYLNNVMTASAIELWEEYSDLATSDTYPLGRCTENQGVSRQTCTDSCICQKVHDSYFINNRANVNGAFHNAKVLMDFECREALTTYCNSIKTNNPPELVENIEFFNYVPSGFTGATGVGCGTLAGRPTTCTMGAGYWVPNTTDDPNASSCTNLTGFVGANPAYSRPGTLYKCTSANTWTAWYTPFTYPHPLRSGSIASTPPPPPPAPVTTVSEPTTTTPTIITVRKTAPGQIKKIFNR